MYFGAIKKVDNLQNYQNCQFNIILTMQICCVYCFDRNNTIMQKNWKNFEKNVLSTRVSVASPSYRGSL